MMALTTSKYGTAQIGTWLVEAWTRGPHTLPPRPRRATGETDPHGSVPKEERVVRRTLVLLTVGLLAFSLAAPGAASVAGVTVTGPTAST